MTHTTQAKIGVFGIGLAAYWPQFEGLKEQLEGYQREVEAQLRSFGGEVISAGLVDDAPKAVAAGDLFARENVDLIVCYVGTYATSSQVLPAVQRVKRPVLILNLQPVAQLDYENIDTGEWLEAAAPAACRRSATPSPAAASSSTWCRACCATMIAPGGRSANGCRRPPWRARSATAASAFSATPTPACSTCTPTSP